MFGGKKEARPLPVDRVRAMMRGGMSEKDIVRQLKGEGYSFGEIEKSLMEVVKEGAAPLPAGAEMGMPPAAAPMPVYEAAPMPPGAPQAEEAPEYAPAYPPAPVYEQYPPPAFNEFIPEDEMVSPEDAMEELIESVAEEKFAKFSTDVQRIEADIERMRAEISLVREKAEVKPPAEIPKDLADRLDSLDARIGGLEKAFRQILPAISENVERLSRIMIPRKRIPMTEQRV